MTWPTTAISTANVDAGADSPALAREQIKESFDALNLLRTNQIPTLRADLASTAAGLGAELVGFKQSGAGAIDRTVIAEQRDRISVKQFGVSASASASANLAAFKSAVAATPVGGRLIVPADSSFYSIDTSGGLSTAIEINKRMEVVFEGDVKATFGTMQANPPYIFRVTAADVTFSGSGKIIGNGTIDDTNAGDELTFPGLVYVTGDRFRAAASLTIDTPPKVGILLANCWDAEIACQFIGGPITYTVSNTAYFGVRMTGGGRHKVVGARAGKDAAGGRLITLVFAGGVSGGSNGCTVTNCFADVHEKVCYLYGDRNTVSHNEVIDALQTDAYRVVGSRNKVFGNRGHNIKGGVSVYDGVYNEVKDNTFTAVQQIAVYVGRLSPSYSGGFTGTKVIGNTGVADGTSLAISDGIYVAVDGADAADIDVCDNDMHGFAKASGEASVRVRAVSPWAISASRVAANRCSDSARSGVVVDRVVGSEVVGNTGRSITGSLLVELGGAGNRFIDNRGRNIGTIGISGLSSTSWGVGNQYTDTELTGVATLAAAAITTVTHGGVAPNARVFLQEASFTAATLTAITGVLTDVSGNNFRILTGNGGGAAGTEQFHYQIVQ